MNTLDTKQYANFKINNNLIDYLFDHNSNKSSNRNRKNAINIGENILVFLYENNIEMRLANTYIGPYITKIEYELDDRKQAKEIYDLYDELKVYLGIDYLIIKQDSPYGNRISFTIENVETCVVDMYTMFKGLMKELCEPLTFPLGVNEDGKKIVCDLNKTNHLLIAGTTGTGKTMFLNTLISSIVMKTNPNECKFVLVDTKRIEFMAYKDMPHLLWPLIDDAQMAVYLLLRLTIIMNERFDALASAGVKNIDLFNQLVEEYNLNLKEDEIPMNKMFNIIVVIDDMTNILNNFAKEIEEYFMKIYEWGRTVGVHLVISTSYPSNNVISKISKTNIPGKIVFDLVSSLDSRIMLNCEGAELLRGNGDMMFRINGNGYPQRAQGTYISDNEIHKIANYVKSKAKPEYEDSYFEFLTNMNGTTVMGVGSANADSMDSLYDDVVEFVKVQQKASTSLLQRRFGIGYNRAARLIDTLEDRGIIGPANGAMPREVYLKPDSNSIRKYDEIETDYVNESAPYLINLTKEELDNSNNGIKEVVNDNKKSSRIKRLFKLFKNK